MLYATAGTLLHIDFQNRPALVEQFSAIFYIREKATKKVCSDSAFLPKRRVYSFLKFIIDSLLTEK